MMADAGARAPLLSTPNLVANSGFARLDTGALADWTGGTGARLLPVQDFDANGLPHAAHALDLAAGGTPPAMLRQPIAAPGAGRYALRVTARRISGAPLGEIVLRTPDGSILCQLAFPAADQWRRHRAECDVATADGLILEIAADGAPGSRLALTDLRLVRLTEAAPRLTVRFDTRGDFALPSSRLRAFLIEDYLDLIGWRTLIGAAGRHDLRVCQKVTPWTGLLGARLAGAAVVYDLDDNELAESLLRRIRIAAFARAADGVTAGGTVLADLLGAWNAHVHLLDNPVDMLDRDVAHDGRDWRGRLVWFGMPENAWMLDALGLSRPVTRITRDGDVAYAVKTIDAHLAGFDLALLPVALDPHTRAKNANRLVKCVALGLPALASDTPEHRRALAALGLPDDVLVAADRDWERAIDRVAADYAAHADLFAAARARAFEVYGIERIVADWVAFCAGLRPRPGR